MVLKVKMEEVTGMGECVAALEAKLSEQGDAMAALKREMADMRRDMALLKGLAEGAGKGSASGKAAEGSGAQPLKGAQVEAARREASEMRGEMGALKAELARMRGAAERQAAEVAYVKATAAHSEARINDVELALAAIKDGRAEKRKEGSGEGQAAAERREGKRRKREERGEEEDMADVPGVDGLALVVAGRAPEGKRDEAERDGDAKEKEEEEDGAEYVDPEDDVQNLRARVEVLEKLSDREGHAWEELIALWVEVRPGKARLDLSGVCLIDGALTRATALRSLTWLSLRGSWGFSADGVTKLYSLTALAFLDLSIINITDAFLEGIGSLKNLRTLSLGKTMITNEGVKKLQGLPQLANLDLDCPNATSASMVHVGKLTALVSLRLYESGVREDGLQHLTALTSLKLFTLPPGVTDSGMKYLRNLKHLEKLGLWGANVTAAGVRWLNGLKSLQVIRTKAEEVAGLIRDNFPGMVVTKDPL